MAALPPRYHRPTATPIFPPKSQKITFQYRKILSPKDFIPFPRIVLRLPREVMLQTIRINIFSNGSYAKQLSYVCDTENGPREISLPWIIYRYTLQTNDPDLEIATRIASKCRQLEKKGFNRV